MPSIHSCRAVLYLVTSIGIVSSVGILLAATLVQAVWKREQPPLWPRLRKYQIFLSALSLCLSIVHCAVLPQYNVRPKGSDPVLVSALFEVLTWIFFCIVLFEGSQDAGPPLYLAWITAFSFQVAECWLKVSAQPRRPSTIVAIDISVLVTRFVCVAFLLGGGLVRLRTKYGVVASEDETQPLLDAEANTTKDQGKGKSSDGGDDSEDEDEDEAESEADAEARKELKQRPFGQYIASYRIFLPHLTPSTVRQWFFVFVIFTCIGANSVINVLAPVAIGALINSLPSAVEQQTIPWKPLIIYLGLNTLQSAGIVSTTQRLATVRFEAEVKRSLSMFCYGHLMDLSSDYHDAKSSQGAHRAMQRGDSIAQLFSSIFFSLFPRFSDLFISIGVITWLFGGYLCFVVATTIVLFIYSNAKFIKQKTKLRRKRIKTLIAQWQHMWETLYSWATISHFNRIDYEKDQAKEKTTHMFKQEILTNDFDAVAQFARQAIVGTGYIIACYLAVRQIIFEGRGIGDFVTLSSYWSQVMSPIAGLISMLNSTAEDLVDAEHILLLLEKKPTVQNPPDAKDLDFKGGAVEFENVSFSYDGERTVTEDISFKIEAGQTVAIVGETGGGKSTLLKLLFRFYDPTKGRILVDGQDLRDFKIESFRDLVGFVPQDPAMFRRSVVENVRYPSLTATDEEVEAACKGAVLHDKIMTFTKGYKQKVGERGTRLSGGEQQRLAVARAIIKKPKMLLLDEATSSVDSVTETKIHECLKDLCDGRTTFIIAHRLSTILHADLILVIKNGKLVEAGPHRKLIKKKGAYRELWTAQLKLQAQNPDGTEVKTPLEGSPVLTKDDTDLLTVHGILGTSDGEGQSSGSVTPSRTKEAEDPDTDHPQDQPQSSSGTPAPSSSSADKLIDIDEDSSTPKNANN